jgi:hypothetical protein
MDDGDVVLDLDKEDGAGLPAPSLPRHLALRVGVTVPAGAERDAALGRGDHRYQPGAVRLDSLEAWITVVIRRRVLHRAHE